MKSGLASSGGRKRKLRRSVGLSSLWFESEPNPLCWKDQLQCLVSTVLNPARGLATGGSVVSARCVRQRLRHGAVVLTWKIGIAESSPDILLESIACRMKGFGVGREKSNEALSCRGGVPGRVRPVWQGSVLK